MRNILTPSENVHNFFAYGVDINGGSLYLGEVEGQGVDSLLAERVIKGLSLLTRGGEHSSIQIIMNNPGGDAYHGAAIYDAIRAYPGYVSIHVMGHAMSMGSVILQAADWRWMHPNSRMMIHYGQFAVDDTAKNSYNLAEECKRLDRWMEDLYLECIREKHPKFTRKRLQGMLNFDTYLTAQEAVELGLADEVFKP